MPTQHVTVEYNDFTSGELSPKLLGRFNSPIYKTGAATMLNYVPMAEGGFRRRPGTRYIGTLSWSTTTRLFPFAAQDGTPYVVEVSNTQARVYAGGNHQLVSGSTMTLPHVTADIPYISEAYVNGQLWLFCNSPANNVVPVYIKNSKADGTGTWSATQTSSSSFTPPSTATGWTILVSEWPACGEFVDGRLFLSGFPSDPNGIFGSAFNATTGAPDYTNFALGSGANTDAIYLEPADAQASGFKWIYGSDKVLAGNDLSVFMEYSTPPALPSTFSMRKSASYGASSAKPVQVINVVLYAAANQRSFRSLIYSLYRGKYYDGDLSINADHLMSRLISDFAVAIHPWPVAWILMSDGTLVSAVVKQEDQGFTVKAGAGFSQHSIANGTVQSICVVPNGNYDDLWMVVDRGGTLYVEYLYLDDINVTTITDSVYVDCAISVTNSPASKTVSGLTALNGYSCIGIGDGAALPAQTILGGSATYDYSVSYATIGMPYASELKTMPPETPARGTSQGKFKRIEQTWFRLYRSYDGWAGTTAPSAPLTSMSPLEQLVYNTYGSQKYGSAPSLFTGDYVFPMSENTDREAQIYLYSAGPFPLNVLALFVRIAEEEI